MTRDLFAEFIGSFALIFIGAGSVMLNAGLTAIAFAHGLVIFAMVAAFGRISGGHFNPAISIAAAICGKLSASKLVQYIIVQLAGAALAAFLLLYLLGNTANVGTPSLAANVSVLGGIVIEAVLTFFFVSVILNTAVFGETSAITPLAIGMTLTFGILFGGPLTGAALNPARALGPALASGDFTNMVVYIVGPIVGAAVAAVAAIAINKRK